VVSPHLPYREEISGFRIKEKEETVEKGQCSLKDPVKLALGKRRDTFYILDIRYKPLSEIREYLLKDSLL